MKRFRDYLSEEVLPTAEVQDGSIDIENPQVRGQINNTLVAVTAQPAVTPYVVLQRIMKALAYFHIILPKKTYMGGDRGVEVYEVHQFGHRMGMTNSGEFVTHVPSKFYLFIHYSTMRPIGLQYSAVDPSLSSVGGMYKVDARLVDADGLEKLMAQAEAHAALHEGCADDKATMSQRGAGREEMQDITSDPKKKGNKEAVEDSEKKSLDEVSLGKLLNYKREREADVRATEISASHSEGMAHAHKGHDEKKSKEFGDEAKWLRGKQDKMKKGISLADKKMKGKAKVNASAPKHPYMEETLDEITKKTAISAYREKEAQERDTSKLHGLIKRKFGSKTAHNAERAGAQSSVGLVRRGEDRGKEDSIARDRRHPRDRMTKSGKVHKQDSATLKGNIKRRLGSHTKPGHLPEENLAEKAPPGAKFERMVKHIKKGYSKDGLTAKERGIAYATAWKAKKKEQMDESMGDVKKSYGMRKMKRKVSTVVKQGLGVQKGKDKTILVTNKGDPKAAAGGGVHRITRDKYDPKKHNMASE